MDKKHYIWMPLIGFDKDQPDKGVDQYIKSAGFTPKGVSVFLFHSDIVNQHEGMDREFVLHPDNCSYYGAPRNEFKERQDWTNLDLRTLAHSLSEKNIEAYLGIMGVYLENTRHYEWESDHPELLSIGVNGKMNLNVLKRFKDGTYYEDFFADKIEKTLLDYGFAGLHVSDFFCPPEHSISNGDFSSDLIDQFVNHSKVELPESIKSRLGFDEQEDIEERQKYIWTNLRREWIDFYGWRWESFWGKISSRLHAIGKKVMINNAWCSDPFEALYRYGIDYRRLYRAGVDILVAETVPTGSELLVPGRGSRFHQFMTMSQCMKAFCPEDTLLTLLGVKDCTEEWDILHHAPPRLEKDMYTLATLYVQNKDKFAPGTDGYMVTLGDGITEDEWIWIGERGKHAFEIYPKKVLAPTVIWSDNAHYALLDEYIKTRRPSLHKHIFDLKNADTTLGAIARIDDLENVDGTIFVPNFDLLSESEKAKILSYNKGLVLCTAPAGFVEENPQIKCDICFEDTLAGYKLCAFAFNASNDNLSIISEVSKLFAEGEAPQIPEGNPKDWFDAPFFSVLLPFNQMSDAFIKSLALVLREASDNLFTSKAWILPVELENNVYRIYVFNLPNFYERYDIMCKKALDKVVPVSKYPVMPPKFVVPPKPGELKLDGAKAESMKIGLASDEIPFGFVAKVPPGGVSVFDVTLR